MIHFTCYGHPEPQGSTKAFIPKGWSRAVITTDNKKLKPWRQQLYGAALDAMAKANAGEVAIIEREIAVCVRMDFYLARPATLAKRFTRPTKKPDWDKLSSAVCDALTGSIITDDSQIVEALVGKWYGAPERVEIVVTKAQEDLRVYEQSSVENYRLFAS